MRKFFIVLAVSLTFTAPSEGGEWLAHKTSILYHKTYSPSSERSGEVTLLFTGDILLDRGVRQYIEHRGADALFNRRMDSLLHSADIVVGNLECPATRVKSPVQKRFIFRAEPEWLSSLKKHGFTHLNLANNHAIDQGRKGLSDTWQNIQRAGMKPVGAGATMKEAAKPILLTNHPRKVWLLPSLRLALENWAYLDDLPTVSQEPMDSVISNIRRIKKADSTAVVIVSLHWGGEHTLRPIPSQRLEAHQLINAGADALVCHHTHTLQTIEEYKGKPIYYSIGNFIFDQQNPINTKACMVKITVGKEGIRTETFPINIKNCKPELKN